jgi:peptidoglycan/xylan/chitin deacetylase (PgdA/CDA1 family)
MYHYVRHFDGARFPKIKGLDVRTFREQLRWIRANSNPISLAFFVAALDGAVDLPPRASLLTFDDGYAEHFGHSLPVLDELKIPAAFFAPVRAVRDGVLLDVNKIHFVLASASDHDSLLRRLFELLRPFRRDFDIAADEALIQTIDTSSRFDPPSVILFKRLLQRELPLPVRTSIADQIFEELVGVAPGVFARELYMTPDQLSYLARNGMAVGGHGFDHLWLGTLPPADQEAEIVESRKFLEKIGSDVSALSFAYPYGSFDQHTPDLLRAHGFRVAFTTRTAVVEFDQRSAESQRYMIPRLDTNDLPPIASSVTAHWHEARVAR